MKRRIDLTPTWSAITPALLDAFLHTTDSGNRADTKRELERMAGLADLWVEHVKSGAADEN
jgi:hypothetical protein